MRQRIDDWTGVGLRQSPSLQAIAALDPDLIIADTRRHETIYPQLSQIAPTVSLPSVQAGYEENLESMRTIGAALDQCDAVDRRLSEHATAMADLAARVPPGVGGVMFGVTSDRAFTAQTADGVWPRSSQSRSVRASRPWPPSSQRSCRRATSMCRSNSWASRRSRSSVTTRTDSSIRPPFLRRFGGGEPTTQGRARDEEPQLPTMLPTGGARRGGLAVPRAHPGGAAFGDASLREVLWRLCPTRRLLHNWTDTAGRVLAAAFRSPD
ncbi:MAG: ABC transporter substrate-binding protein [Egibacteraceae bacterium]